MSRPPVPLPTHQERLDLHLEATARVRDLARSAARGDGGALVVVAEAGIGKSTVLDDAEQEWSDRVTILRTVGHETEVESSFGGLSRLLWPVRGHVDALDEHVAARVLAALGIGPHAKGDRFAVASAVLALLSQLGPTICLVDDWHALDAGSRAALAFAGRRLASTSIGMVIASRPPAAAELSGLTRVDLHPLDREQLLALASSLGLPVSGHVATDLLAATGGNTLAIVEAVHSLDARQRDGRAQIGSINFGTSLVEAFSRPLPSLSDHALATLHVLALHAEGDPLVVDRSLALLGFPSGAFPADELAEFVEADERTVHFRHPLRRAAIAQSLDDEESRRVHRAIGEAYRELGDAEASAVHLASGALPPDRHLAQVLEDAAERAADRGDLAQASLRLERSANFSVSMEERAMRLLRAATIAAQAGQPADDLFERAQRAGRNSGIALQAKPTRALVASWQGDHDLVLELAGEAQRNGAELATWPAAVLVGLGCHIAWNRVDLKTFNDLWDSLKSATGPLDLSAARGPELMVLVELLQFGVLVDRSPVDEDLLEVLLKRIVTDAEVDIAPTAGFSLLVLDRPERAAALTSSLRGAAVRNGAVAASTWLDAVDAMRLESCGRPDGAQRLALEGMAQAEALGLPWAEEVCRAVATRCSAIRGDLDEVRAHLETADKGTSTNILMHGMRASLGLCLMGMGEVATARDHLAALRGDAANALTNPFFNRMHADLVECLVGLDDLVDAKEVADEYARHLLPSAGRLAAALLARVAGLVAPLVRSEAHFEEALAHHATHPDAFEQARTQFAYGIRLRRLRRPTDAQDQLAKAASTFRKLGADPWAQRARHQAELAGARPPAAQQVESQELTPQERAVIAEVVRGRRNREIAAALFISPKTVEAHLTRIYRKLDVRSRTELLRWTTSDQQK